MKIELRLLKVTPKMPETELEETKLVARIDRLLAGNGIEVFARVTESTCYYSKPVHFTEDDVYTVEEFRFQRMMDTDTP